jgi:predicted secreted protein
MSRRTPTEHLWTLSSPSRRCSPLARRTRSSARTLMNSSRAGRSPVARGLSPQVRFLNQPLHFVLDYVQVTHPCIPTSAPKSSFLHCGNGLQGRAENLLEDRVSQQCSTTQSNQIGTDLQAVTAWRVAPLRWLVFMRQSRCSTIWWFCSFF